MRLFCYMLTSFCLICSLNASADSLPDHIKAIKPSIVAIGMMSPTASPRITLLGSGFVVGNGRQIATNFHIIARPTDPALHEQYVVLSGHGERVEMHPVNSFTNDPAHDIAVLTISRTLQPLSLSTEPLLAEGNAISFTGYPITSVLGLYPATHRGIIAAHTPVVIPAQNARDLQTRAIRALKEPYFVYQLDATAYPGNSGSPLFSAQHNKVIGIINQVHVKSTKEAVLADPSGITYAIPIRYLSQLLNDGAQP